MSRRASSGVRFYDRLFAELAPYRGKRMFTTKSSLSGPTGLPTGEAVGMGHGVISDKVMLKNRDYIESAIDDAERVMVDRPDILEEVERGADEAVYERFGRVTEGKTAIVPHFYASQLNVLEDPNTKRMLFDARQAALFDDIDEAPPEDRASKLRPPFDQFYLEFTEPVKIGESEPGHSDYMRALMYQHNIATIHVPIGDPPEVVDLPVSQIVMYGTGDDGSIIDQSWKMHLSTGMTFTSISACTEGPDPSAVPAKWPFDGYLPLGLQNIGEWCDGGELAGQQRYFGWFERHVLKVTGLIQWMLAYTMAKGVRIYAESLSRGERRRFEHRKELPRPWHLVEVEPKYIVSSGTHHGIQEGTGTEHRYRYDVIGHLRFGKHKLKGDGQYSHTIEWVPPHQRGLRHTLYIPKTYGIKKGGKKILEVNREYFKSSPELLGPRPEDE